MAQEEQIVAAETAATTESPKAEAKATIEYRPGMKIAIDQEIEEVSPKGEIKKRIQTFEGTIIARAGSGKARTITVRKVTSGVGVEKILPVNMPSIKEIRIVSEAKTRRAKLHFTRAPRARSLKEKSK